MAETIHVLDEGGGVQAMDLPLHPAIAERMTKGMIRRCNPDGSPWEEPDEQAEGGAQVPTTPTERPADSARKPVWVGWAVACGAKPDEAEALTKPDLIEKYGHLTPEKQGADDAVRDSGGTG